MQVFTNEKELQEKIKSLLNKEKTIGFVPTMGALHSGHISLINASKKTCDYTICSIFVNPTQFDRQEDLDKYPITVEADKALLEKANCDFLLLPSVAEVYPNGKDNYTAPEIGKILTVLEGAHRSGHFEGVMQVVERLLRMTLATDLFMGLKDYQQFLICSKMTKAVGINVRMHGMPIIREESGLAKSSRNVRLSKKGKKTASKLHKRLCKAQELLEKKSFAKVEKKIRTKFDKNDAIKLEYFEIVDKNTLLKPENLDQKENLIALLAAWVEGVRLIDNKILS